MAPFSHLHVHSCFSFHDGADQPAALVAHAAELGYSALALTDTNGLYGAVPFCKAAKAAGITPLLGAEIGGDDSKGPRAVVLARGRAGYPALCRLVTRRHLERSLDEAPFPPQSSHAENEEDPARRTTGAGTRTENGTKTDAGVARRGGLSARQHLSTDIASRGRFHGGSAPSGAAGAAVTPHSSALHLNGAERPAIPVR